MSDWCVVLCLHIAADLWAFADLCQAELYWSDANISPNPNIFEDVKGDMRRQN